MKFIIALAAALAALAPAAAAVVGPVDCHTVYHDEIKALTDTVVTFPVDTAAVRVILETRGRFASASPYINRNTASWGVIWGDYPRRYYRAMLSLRRTGENDAIDRDFVHLDIVGMEGDEPVTPVNTISLYDNVDASRSGENSMEIVVEPMSGVTTVYVGNHRLYQVAAETLAYPGGVGRWGIIARGPVEITTAVDEMGHLRTDRLLSEWTAETLDGRFATSSDPVEGYWDYLDRENDEQLSRMGGRYRLALVSDGADGYDIIYVGGATINRDLWKTGMKRGHLAKTDFAGHYDLRWFDSSFEEIVHEAFANIEQGSILSLNFPLYGAKVRFSKAE